MPLAADDIALHAAIDRRVRQRMVGVALCLALAALLSIGVFKSMAMMHGDGDYTVVDARIVAVVRDPPSGKLRMTSEFRDAAGIVHRDTQDEGYHYAPGEPQVGQRIEYLYTVGPRTGDVYAFPRADRVLQWAFGAPAALLVAVAALLAWIILRDRAWRRRLVRVGRRETGQAPSIRRRTLPAGNNGQAIAMWRVQARWFDPARAAFVDCRSDWQAGPEPDLESGAWTPTILVDPDDPTRCWLPVPTP